VTLLAYLASVFGIQPSKDFKGGLVGVALALSLLASGAHAQGSVPSDASAASGNGAANQPEIVMIAVKGAGLFGRDVDMVTLLYKPPGSGPFPVVVFSHGRAGDRAGRSKLTHPVSIGQVRYWTVHGFAVVAPIRPGYGATGGPDAENSGTVFSGASCVTKPDFRSTAAAGERATQAALEWLGKQSWADTNRVILVGQSVGGLVTIATAADRPHGVLAYVNFAGGAGGSPERSPGHSCAPEELTLLYAEFGKTTTTPNLWIYAQNDQYWGAQMPKAWHDAFASNASNASDATLLTTFIEAPPVPDADGHGLSRHAQSLWAPYLDSFLSSLGLAK
jgi:dienelactone hydrolase